MPFLVLFFALGPLWQYPPTPQPQESPVDPVRCLSRSEETETTQKIVEDWLRRFDLYESGSVQCPDVRIAKT